MKAAVRPVSRRPRKQQPAPPVGGDGEGEGAADEQQQQEEQEGQGEAGREQQGGSAAADGEQQQQQSIPDGDEPSSAGELAARRANVGRSGDPLEVGGCLVKSWHLWNVLAHSLQRVSLCMPLTIPAERFS